MSFYRLRSATPVSGAASTTGTSSTQLIAAPAATNAKLYVGSLVVANSGASASLITLQAGSGGTAIGYTIAPAGGGSNIIFDPPIEVGANTALYFQPGTGSTTIYVTASGFISP